MEWGDSRKLGAAAYKQDGLGEVADIWARLRERRGAARAEAVALHSSSRARVRSLHLPVNEGGPEGQGARVLGMLPG